ncbi:MAG: hypothetical protein HY288_19225 [Planctomycetia bacterium]|nr:hypothetical protein [Planctomycetia bacterium]
MFFDRKRAFGEVPPNWYDRIAGALSSLEPANTHYSTHFVEILLAAGRERGARDLHLQPTPEELELRSRTDGVFIGLGTHPSGVAAKLIARLTVLADLLPSCNDEPREGRVRADDADVEVRVSTIPRPQGEPFNFSIRALFPNSTVGCVTYRIIKSAEARIKTTLPDMYY